MPNTSSPFNPAYSTVQSIFLATGTTQSNPLDIVAQNQQCRFERLEMTEDITSAFPTGIVLVKDFQDIVSYIQRQNLRKVIIKFFDGTTWNMDITSVAYINNAASTATDTLVAINFSNEYYIKFSSTSLNSSLGIKKPNVFKMTDFVSLLKSTVFGTTKGYNDTATNYFLYRPFIPLGNGDEMVPDNAVEMMSYLTTAATDSTNNPYYVFWTSLNGDVNFKSFKRDITQDPSYSSIDANFLNIGVFDGDSVLQKLSDGKTYRKAYFYATNPAYQYISKNYYYIRKTPKCMDAGLTIGGMTSTNDLAFHFKDQGQKFNIESISSLGRNMNAPLGGDELHTPDTYGYFDESLPNNDQSMATLIGNQYGTQASYSAMSLMGITGFMPFLDSPDMWKNMFDLTPVHPHYPDALASPGITGSATNLQKVMDIRYAAFTATTGGDQSRLEQIRAIEAQNFVMYSLCCMGRQTDDTSFFAVLQEYEQDSNTPTTGPASGKIYRYKWNKINFMSAYGATGPTGTGGYYMHQLEKWALDATVKSSDTQDDTWAINVNERGLTGNYLPPGWTPSGIPTGFRYRPIGANETAVPASGDINHLVRMYRVSMNTLLTESGNQIYPAFDGKYLNYFWAENVEDGSCSSGATA